MSRKDIANIVHEDLERRISKGAEQYGERLTSHNGRDALWDAYEEALDLALYLRQAIQERDDLNERMSRILNADDPDVKEFNQQS